MNQLVSIHLSYCCHSVSHLEAPTLPSQILHLLLGNNFEVSSPSSVSWLFLRISFASSDQFCHFQLNVRKYCEICKLSRSFWLTGCPWVACLSCLWCHYGLLGEWFKNIFFYLKKSMYTSLGLRGSLKIWTRFNLIHSLRLSWISWGRREGESCHRRMSTWIQSPFQHVDARKPRRLLACQCYHSEYMCHTGVTLASRVTLVSRWLTQHSVTRSTVTVVHSERFNSTLTPD